MKSQESDNMDTLTELMQKENADSILYELAETFRVLGDQTRVRILMVLIKSEMCVGDIAQELNLTDSAVSHQLRILRNSRLVVFRKEGKNAVYSVSDEHVATIFREGIEHVEGM